MAGKGVVVISRVHATFASQGDVWAVTSQIDGKVESVERFTSLTMAVQSASELSKRLQAEVRLGSR